MIQNDEFKVKDKKLPLYRINTLVVGSGAASLNSAIHLNRLGINDVLIATNEMGGGTSANAGSDKQTYYKLSLSGTNSDSPVEMAKTYYDSGATHGDIALIESALSTREFFHLAELGVDFPFNRFGEYVGYKTDHDPRGRGTSAGPWTSQQMVNKLKEEVDRLEIELMDSIEIIGLLVGEETSDKRVLGALGIDKTSTERDNFGFVVFSCENIIFGVGGPGGLYEDSVYPESQIGSIGIALDKGAVASNLTEGQFGLASTDFRWNLSGSYQQVIPRYYSIDDNGKERDFLNQIFPSTQRLAEAIFLKGYQWPFNPNKIQNFGSSLIDLLVYRETKLEKRQVFLDYRRNPSSSHGLNDFNINKLAGEPKDYLSNSNALGETPIERLEQLNPQAIELYLDQGIDLTSEPLEIAVCAQHNNGGLRGNIWWESNINHLFPIGEVNGSHGVARPGGSALNAGQVGGLRAAQYIGKQYPKITISNKHFKDKVRDQIRGKLNLATKILERSKSQSELELISPEEAKITIQHRMSQFGAHIRNKDKLPQATKEASEFEDKLPKRLKVKDTSNLPSAFQALHLALSSQVYLEAIKWYVEHGGGSRGSYLIKDPDGARQLERFDLNWWYRKENEGLKNKVQETYLDLNGNVQNRWVKRKQIPESSQWFESVWRDYRSNDVFNAK